MSAIDELREMLDERGVEHEGGERSLRWRDRYGVMMQAFPLADGELGMEVWSCTPEQAIAATLGSCNCTNGERTRTCLPHFWTHDGTLHVELPKLPESISVRLPDQRDREVGSARTWQYTRDSGTCHITDNGPCGYPYVCSACGASFDPDVNGGELNYCPNCGRRIEVDDG